MLRGTFCLRRVSTSDTLSYSACPFHTTSTPSIHPTSKAHLPPPTQCTTQQTSPYTPIPTPSPIPPIQQLIYYRELQPMRNVLVHIIPLTGTLPLTPPPTSRRNLYNYFSHFSCFRVRYQQYPRGARSMCLKGRNIIPGRSTL